MAARHLSKLVFALALFSLPCAANVITYSAHANSYAPMPSGNHIEVSDTLNLPQFDPSLGTLNAVSFGLNIGGQLAWEEISNPGGITNLDFHVDTFVSILGLTGTHAQAAIFGFAGRGPGGSPCNVPGYPAPCGPGHSGVGDVYLLGDISDGSSSAHFQSYISAQNTLTGAPPTSLSAFIGTSTFSLPVWFAFDASGGAPSQYMGGLLGPQSVGIGLDWTYNYTPALSVSSALAAGDLVSSAPEPGFLGLLAAVFAALVSYSRCARDTKDNRRRGPSWAIGQRSARR